MAETKSCKVTFETSLPMGTRGTFTHDKTLWIAYPAEKNQRIFVIVDRLLGIHNRITATMIGWINERPGDAELISRVLEMTGRARELTSELIIDKTEAFTS